MDAFLVAFLRFLNVFKSISNIVSNDNVISFVVMHNTVLNEKAAYELSFSEKAGTFDLVIVRAYKMIKAERVLVHKHAFLKDYSSRFNCWCEEVNIVNFLEATMKWPNHSHLESHHTTILDDQAE